MNLSTFYPIPQHTVHKELQYEEEINVIPPPTEEKTVIAPTVPHPGALVPPLIFDNEFILIDCTATVRKDYRDKKVTLYACPKCNTVQVDLDSF